MHENLPQYKCSKTVGALTIANIVVKRQGGAFLYFKEEGWTLWYVDQVYLDKHKPKIGGYVVMHDGPYCTFCPAEPFDLAFDKIG